MMCRLPKIAGGLMESPVSPGSGSGYRLPLHDRGLMTGPVGISQDALVQFPRL